MIDKKIKNKIKKTLRKYLGTSEYKIFIFGSWATKTNRQFSDVDVGLLGSRRISRNVIIRMQEELEKSTIPYRIDVVDFKRVSPEFKNVALQKIEYL
jgi:predicted nucleotidyltransferase